MITKALVWCDHHKEIEAWEYDAYGKLYFQVCSDDGEWLADLRVDDKTIEDAFAGQRITILYKEER